MEILCLGLSHHTAPVEIRERFAIAESLTGELSSAMASYAGLSEGVVISTCNRVEFYAVAQEPGRGFELMRRFLSERGLDIDGAGFFERPAQEGVRHLFRVVSGLESMVLGETEILGQVKKAYQAAQDVKATSRHLNKLFQRAFNVAKEVRTQTNITRGSVSVGSVAVELAEKIFGNLAHCGVMILGAGETSELTAGALQARGVKTLFVANRSHDRAVALAEKMGGRALHFDDWTNEFGGVDILIGSTAAPHHVLTREKLAPIMARRRHRPLFCIDLAVPRDIEPSVNKLEGVYLYDIDSLQSIASQSMAERRQEVGLCEKLIERHVVEFSEWLASPHPSGQTVHGAQSRSVSALGASEGSAPDGTAAQRG
jgi:glutamyl-tRNA reductase